MPRLHCTIEQVLLCGMSYEDCLKSKGITVEENDTEMATQEARGLSQLFSKTSIARLSLNRKKYFNHPFEGRQNV